MPAWSGLGRQKGLQWIHQPGKKALQERQSGSKDSVGGCFPYGAQSMEWGKRTAGEVMAPGKVEFHWWPLTMVSTCLIGSACVSLSGRLFTPFSRQGPLTVSPVYHCPQCLSPTCHPSPPPTACQEKLKELQVPKESDSAPGLSGPKASVLVSFQELKAADTGELRPQWGWGCRWGGEVETGKILAQKFGYKEKGKGGHTGHRQVRLSLKKGKLLIWILNKKGKIWGSWSGCGRGKVLS